MQYIFYLQTMKSSLKRIFSNITVFSIKATYVFTLCIIFSLIVLYGISRILEDQNPNYTKNTISIKGRASKSVKPDQAVINLGANFTGKNIIDLQEKAHKAVNEATIVIENLNIDKEDITVNNYNVSPNYDYSTNEIKNYEIYINMQVKIENLSENDQLISKVIKASTQAGLNQVYGLYYEISNRDEILKELKEQAIKNAKDEKEHTEEILGIKLGKLIATDLDHDYYPYPTPVMDFESRTEVESQDQGYSNVQDIEFNPSSSELEAEVILYYEIK